MTNCISGYKGVKQQEYDFDLFVIGAGSGGIRASRTSAGFGAKGFCFSSPFPSISAQGVKSNSF